MSYGVTGGDECSTSGVLRSRLVIAGLPRCGTTLLATFLNAQEGCRFISDYIPSIHALVDSLDVGWQQPLTRPQRRAALAVTRGHLLQWRHVLATGVDDFRTLDQLHRAMLDDMRARHEVAAGHKAVLSPAQMRRMLAETDILCLFLYRDPRDAALSYWHRTGGGIEAYLQDWKQRVRAMRALQANPRFFPIRYECLVQNPMAALSSLQTALALDFDYAHLRLQSSRGVLQGEQPWQGNSVFGDVVGAFSSSPVERWRRHLGSPVVRYAAVTCAKEIAQLGYADARAPAVSPRERWSYRKHALIHETDRRLSESARSFSRKLRARFAPSLQHSDRIGRTSE